MTDDHASHPVRGDGRLRPSAKTVFLHTGGMPALFASAYASWGREVLAD